MGTIEERKINGKKIKDIIAFCAKGNEGAKKYLLSFAYAARVFDDLIDKDYSVSDDQICRAFFILSAELWTNPFFVKYAQFLIPLHIASFNAFMDSNTWADSGDNLKKTYAHVMKDFSNELLGLVAFLTGGYSHMSKVSLSAKELFIEEI